MALTGLDIYKKLPKENCKECGLPTCLAFAMKVAAGQAGLDKCPRLSDEARGELGEASAPPQRLVAIGTGDKAFEIGQETVLFRHEEKFHHPTAVALTLSDKGSEADLKAACETFKTLAFTRVGQTLTPHMIALMNDSGEAAPFVAAAKIAAESLDVPAVLVGTAEAVEAAATGPYAGKKPLLYCRGEVTAEALAELAKKADAPVCVAGSLEQVAESVDALGKLGIKDVVISAGPYEPAGTLDFLTRSRRAALRKKFRPLGCPVLSIAIGEDKAEAALEACVYTAKYSGIVISDAWEPHLLVPILTTRQNIYTDPQKPVQVEAKMYDIGEVTPDSPVLVTTNFSLSYYSVEAEAEASRVGVPHPRRRHRGHQRADGLGGRQVQRRDHHGRAEEGQRRRAGLASQADPARSRGGPGGVGCRRVRLAGSRGPEGGHGHRTVPEERLEGGRLSRPRKL